MHRDGFLPAPGCVHARSSSRAILLHPPMHMNKQTILRLMSALFGVLAAIFLSLTASGQSDLSPSVPAGPQPTATVTPLQTTPVPTATVTPLPSASPAGTQPQTTNTVTPAPTASPSPTHPQTTNTVTPSPTP
jgi:hypothetical protein